MKTFKTEFFPTAKQREYIAKACGIRRWTWNWAVATFYEAAKSERFPTAFDLKKQLNNTLVLEPEYSWLSEVNSMVRAEAFKDFGLAMTAYAKARRLARRTNQKLDVDKGKPNFKKKGKSTESFRVCLKGGSEFKVHSPHRMSVVTTRNHPRFQVHTIESIEFLQNSDIKTCTFSMKGGRYFISITYERTNQRKRKCGIGKVGIDLGIKHAVVAFNGQDSVVFDIPSNLKKAERKTERCNKRLTRAQKGSKRRQKLLLQVECAYMHEANIKKDWREKLTTQLVCTYDKIVIDDFGFEGAKNLDINRALYRVGCYAFKIALQRKAEEAGVDLVFIPKGTPTTKTCSHCGSIKEMKLSDRTYVCSVCGLIMDRDQNSAINAYNYC